MAANYHRPSQRLRSFTELAESGVGKQLAFVTRWRIWQCYYEAATNKDQAMRDLIGWNDPKLFRGRVGKVAVLPANHVT